jgi:hypothetical protein
MKGELRSWHEVQRNPRSMHFITRRAISNLCSTRVCGRIYLAAEQDDLLGDLEKGVGRLGQQSRTLHDEAQLHKVGLTQMCVQMRVHDLIEARRQTSLYLNCNFLTVYSTLQRLLDDIDGDIDAAGASLRVEARHAAKVCETYQFFDRSTEREGHTRTNLMPCDQNSIHNLKLICSNHVLHVCAVRT